MGYIYKFPLVKISKKIDIYMCFLWKYRVLKNMFNYSSLFYPGRIG